MMRDVWSQKGTYIACVMIMVIGLMTFNLFSIGYDNFSYSRDVYYKEMNFADGFANVKGMPTSELRKLEALKEIKVIEGRLIKDVRIIQDDQEGNAYLRLISFVPETNDSLNQFELQSGGIPKNGKKNEIVLDSKYYDATNRGIGDKVSVAAAGGLLT